jgi:DMSO/TMAO reductase YedYZ molybdopterin-dependent catalytic subunit
VTTDYTDAEGARSLMRTSPRFISHLQGELAHIWEQGLGATALELARGATWVTRRYTIALVAGFLGSAAATLLMGLLRVTLGTLTPPELVGERLLPLLSVDQFIALLIEFRPNSKTGPLGLALLGQFVIGILVGPLVEHVARVPAHSSGRWPNRSAWLGTGAVALTMELVALLLFWPVLSANLAGDPPGRARLFSLLALALTFGGFAAVTLLADWWLLRAWGPYVLPREPAPSAVASGEDASTSGGDEGATMRRAALQAAGMTLFALTLGALGFNRLLAAYCARSNLAYEGMQTPPPVVPITPVEDFYVVSKNILDPMVDVGRWQLELSGLVKQARTWNYRGLLALPSETRAVTLECISNDVGGHLMSTAEWRGVPLAALLEAAGGAEPAGTYVVFQAVDGYLTSLPLAALLEVRTLLAYQINGAPLPARHGYPLRAVVPGRFGEQSAKWLTRVELSATPVKGLYQSQGWSEAPVETTSRIDAPGRDVPLGVIPVAGVAFGGTRGIAEVEVSADGGATWHEATLDPPLSDQSWVFWRWAWQPAVPGTYTLVVRATDGTGTTQTRVERGTVPKGATGWHRVQVKVH